MVIAIFGPTAAGKTEICVELADLLRAEGRQPTAVSADALQVYAGLDVLTAKPTPAQLERLEHRLISHVPIDAEYSAGQYAGDAHREIDGLLAAGRTPIVIGGTGLYMRAALADLSFDASAGDRGELWSAQTRHPTTQIGVTLERAALYERAEARVEKMLAGGALDEVRAALAQRPSRTAAKALGIAEIRAYLENRSSYDEMVQKIERRTRNYARRQLTWMRKAPLDHTLDRSELDAHQAAAELMNFLTSSSD